MKFYIYMFILIYSLTSKSVEVDKPKFIPISKCPGTAKLIIFDMKLDTNKIHSCNVKTESALNYNSKIKVVELAYGNPTDCPSGCVYSTYAAIIEGDGQQGQLIQVPMRSSTFLNPAEFPEYKDRSRLKNFNCEPSNIQRISKATYGKEGKTWGLYIELQKPFVCKWIKTTSTKYQRDYKSSMNEGFKMRGEWTGSVFFQAHPMSDSDKNTTRQIKIKYTESQLDPISWEEKH